MTSFYVWFVRYNYFINILAENAEFQSDNKRYSRPTSNIGTTLYNFVVSISLTHKTVLLILHSIRSNVLSI
jgi:hypothetical protein